TYRAIARSRCVSAARPAMAKQSYRLIELSRCGRRSPQDAGPLKCKILGSCSKALVALLDVGCKHFNKVVYSHFGLQADHSLFDLGYFNPGANFVEACSTIQRQRNVPV